MKWMRERDLLIAQTMAFVQSVTGKKPDAGMFVGVPEAATATTLTTTVVDVAAMVTETTVISEPDESEASPNQSEPSTSELSNSEPVKSALPKSEPPRPIQFRVPSRCRCPIRDQGTDCELPRASRALPARARRVLQRDHGQGPRRLGRKRRAATIRQIAAEARTHPGFFRSSRFFRTPTQQVICETQAASRSSLEPGAYQRHIGRAGQQQRHGERQVQALATGVRHRRHGRNIQRFRSGVWGFFFSGNCQDLGSPPDSQSGPSPACERRGGCGNPRPRPTCLCGAETDALRAVLQ